jgi:WD40 repeat protein
VPKIADFGLAKRLDDAAGLTACGAFVGTPSYMAPEQCGPALGRANLRGPVGAAADVYALGAVLYELLTGRPPFRAATLLETVRHVLDDEPVPPRRLQPGTPRDLDTICLKCLEKDPAKRYATAAALADDLDLLLADRPIKARPAGRAERAWRWCRRNRAAAGVLGLAALLLVTLAAGSAVAAVLQHRRHQEAEQALEAVREAERGKTARLYAALVAQARANRMSRRPGQRFGTLATIRQALELGGPSDELRTEAAAALSLPDIELIREWDGCPFGTFWFCFDGRFERYAHMDRDGNVSVRRLADDTAIAYRAGFGGPAWGGVTLSPDGRLLAQRCQPGGRVKLWDLGEPDRLPLLDTETGDDLAVVAFRPDSSQGAFAQPDRTVLLFDVASGERRRLPLDGNADRLAFHPTLPRLAVSSGSVVRVLELPSGKKLAELRPGDFVTTVAWHPGGELLATGSNDNHITLWDAAAGKKVAVFNCPGAVGIHLAFDPTGHLLLSNESRNILRLWEVESGEERLTLHATYFGHFDDKGRLLAGVAGRDPLRIYRVATGREFRTLTWRDGATPSGHGAIGTTPSPDGRTVAVTVPDGVTLLELATGRIRAHLSSRGDWAVQFESSGALLTAGPGGLRRWPVTSDPDHPDRLRTGPPQLLVNGEPRNVQWGCSSDAAVVAVPALDNGTLLIHRGRNPGSLDLRPQQDVRSASVSPDGRWVATGSHSGLSSCGAKVWDSGTGRLVKELPAGSLCAVRFSPDGKRLITTGSGLRLWAVGTWEEIPTVGGVQGVFSADSRLLAVGDEFGVTRLVDPATGREYARLEPQVPVWPACFSLDGSQLILYDAAGRAVHIWDLRALRRQLAELGLDWDLPPIPAAGPPAGGASRVTAVSPGE